MKRKCLNKYKPNWGEKYYPYDGILNDKLVGQCEAVSQVAAIMAAFKNRPPGSDFPAPRVLIVGGPGSGKSYLADEVAKLLAVPFTHINLAAISPPGYRGYDLGVGLRSLVEKCGHTQAEKSSAIILDEMDKLIRRGRDEFNKQIEFSLLPILNGDPVLVDDDGYDSVPKTFSSKNSLMLLMGVFPGISSSVWSDPEKAKQALAKYGYTAELVSRLTHFIYLKPIKKEDLKKLVEREVEAHSSIYQTEDYRPMLTPSELARAVNIAQSSAFGIRGLRVNINKWLYKKAVQSGLSAMGVD